MRCGDGFERLQMVSRVALLAMIGGLAASCSSDSARFSDATFSNPFSSRAEPSETGTIPDAEPAPYSPAPMPRSSVQSAPLSAPQSYPQSANPQAPLPLHSARPPAAAALAPTQTGAGGWSNRGGSTVTVGQNDSLSSLSTLYGVPPQAILKANGLASASQVQPGSRLVIPVYSASGGDTGPVAAAPAPRRTLAAAPQPMPADAKSANRYRMSQGAPAGGKLAPAATDSARPQPVAPGKPMAEFKKGAQPAPKVAKTEEPKPKPEKVAAAPKAVAAPQPEPAKPAAKEPDATGALPSGAEFRWPARGRVISGFGGSGGNEGINIAVPDGTPVKAAESGTVAYAGSEVKGYGNLVLIRHDNGFVSAYAHNGDLNVKRGDKVKRGQVVAKSGQSGNVTSPQIHFEIRKGSTPVDPTPYLAGNS